MIAGNRETAVLLVSFNFNLPVFLQAKILPVCLFVSNTTAFSPLYLENAYCLSLHFAEPLLCSSAELRTWNGALPNRNTILDTHVMLHFLITALKKKLKGIK